MIIIHHDHMLQTWTYGWCTPSCWSSRPHHCRGWQEPPDVWQLVTDSSLAAVSPNLEFLNFPIAKKSLHKMVILTSTRCIRRLWLDSGCWIGIKDISHLLIPINDGLLLLCFWSSNHLKGEELVDVDGLGVASSRLKPETGAPQDQSDNLDSKQTFWWSDRLIIVIVDNLESKFKIQKVTHQAARNLDIDSWAKYWWS